MTVMTFLSIGDMPAEDGFSAVLVSALGAFGALALIFLVLVIMNKIHEKNNPSENEQEYEQKTNDEDNEQ